MEPPNRPKRLTALQLEQLALGEATPNPPLSPEEEAQVQALRDSSAQILARYPAAPQAEQIAARVAQAKKAQPRPRTRLWLPLAISGIAALAVVALRPRDASQDHVGKGATPYGDTIVAKGGPALASLRLYRQTQGQIEPLPSGASARAGDLLQLALVPGKARHGVLVSIDGSGGVTLHFPQREGDSTQLSDREGPASERAEIRLPQSFRLDNAPRFERLFLLTAEEAQRDPLQVREILDRARRLAADPSHAQTADLPNLPASITQQSLILHKDAR